MKRAFFIIAALALLAPAPAMAQGSQVVIRPEVHGTVIVIDGQVHAIPANEQTALALVQVIRRNEAKIVGLQAIPNTHLNTVAAINQCQRNIYNAKQALRELF